MDAYYPIEWIYQIHWSLVNISFLLVVGIIPGALFQRDLCVNTFMCTCQPPKHCQLRPFPWGQFLEGDDEVKGHEHLPRFVTYPAKLAPGKSPPPKISRQWMRLRPRDLTSWCSDAVGGIRQGWRDTISSGCNGFVWQPVRGWMPAGLMPLPLIVPKTHLETPFTWNFGEVLAARIEIG